LKRKIDRDASAGKILSLETKCLAKTIKCKGCGHSFGATIHTKNLDANNVGDCPLCGGCDFEFVARPRGR
jgi:hypothetical protein